MRGPARVVAFTHLNEVLSIRAQESRVFGEALRLHQTSMKS